MKKSMVQLMMALGAFMLMFSGAAAAQSDKPVPYQEGLHYVLIDQAPLASGDKIELVEAFSYLCTHCNTFEPYIQGWIKRKPDNVEFRRIPVVFGRDSWELYARGYVTANLMNVPAEAHIAMMDRLWKEKKIMRSMDELADFYSQYGLDKDKFLSTSRSFAVDSKIRKDQVAVKSFGITGTPALVLNGKYRISGNAAVANYDVLLDVVDYLIEMETAEMQKSSAASDTAAAGSASESE
jgi:thiol:disulfide interchange protein DsbA